MSTINERFSLLIENLAKGNQSEFARSIGISQSTLATYLGRSEPGFGILHKIAVAYPDLNADWLLTGKGGMFKPKGTTQTNTIAGNVGNLAGRDITVQTLLEQENRLLKEQLNDKEHIIELLRMKH